MVIEIGCLQPVFYLWFGLHLMCIPVYLSLSNRLRVMGMFWNISRWQHFPGLKPYMTFSGPTLFLIRPTMHRPTSQMTLWRDATVGR